MNLCDLIGLYTSEGFITASVEEEKKKRTVIPSNSLLFLFKVTFFFKILYMIGRMNPYKTATTKNVFKEFLHALCKTCFHLYINLQMKNS